MKRRWFLGIAGGVGLFVGLVAIAAPSVILAAKGVALREATLVWVREVGTLIVAASLLVVLVRAHEDSATLRAVLVANGALHALLLPVELLAWHANVLMRLDGVLPNSVLHGVLAGGFVYFAVCCRSKPVVERI